MRSYLVISIIFCKTKNVIEKIKTRKYRNNKFAFHVELKSVSKRVWENVWLQPKLLIEQEQNKQKNNYMEEWKQQQTGEIFLHSSSML